MIESALESRRAGGETGARPDAGTAYPAHLVHDHVLFDGRTVTIRPIRAGDGDLERRFLNELSGESRYMRFQAWVNAPTERLIHFLTDIDYERHLALVCTNARADAEEIAGEARYVTADDGRSCEFGIVIGDAWHRTGVAGLLMADLMHAAREARIEVMEGQVLTANRLMLRFARALGFSIEPVPEDPTIRHIVKRL